MKDIGGYYGLELAKSSAYYHTGAMQFQSGRSALHFILSNTTPAHVHVPFYTCDALLQPLVDLGIPYTFYQINDRLEINDPPFLARNEYLVYINYYDIKRAYVNQLSARYKHQLIVDCSQAYFVKGNGSSWFFNSARKFFGVPDGADLYTPQNWDLAANYRGLYANTVYSIEHLFARFNGRTEDGYEGYLLNEELVGMKYDKMSVLSERLLQHVDFNEARQKRIQNFNYLHKKLGAGNQLIINTEQAAPSYYPYLPPRFIEKRAFWKEHMFIPNLWRDCAAREDPFWKFELEKHLSTHLFPVPTDHRYREDELEQIIQRINTTDYNGFYDKI